MDQRSEKKNEGFTGEYFHGTVTTNNNRLVIFYKEKTVIFYYYCKNMGVYKVEIGYSVTPVNEIGVKKSNISNLN